MMITAVFWKLLFQSASVYRHQKFDLRTVGYGIYMLCGSKSLKISPQIVRSMRINILQICKEFLLLPEVLGTIILQ